ncbi:MAG: GntR family transcriptional regulator [Cryobacterium sp.]|nr:GntR family transcriptional regulator [Cryobacterium sp.]
MFTLGRSNAGLDREAPTALHSQVSDAIRSFIVSGRWPPHHQLKSEPELAVDLGVSRGTLRRAISTLIEEGLLKQVHGKGTFVTETLLEPAVAQKLSTLSEDFASQGVVLDTTVRESGLRVPPLHVARLLHVPVTEMVFRIERVRRTGSTPIALLHNYVRSDLAPGIDSVDFTATTLFGALEGRFGLSIGNARRTFSALAASPEVAEALAIDEGAPVLYLEQLTFTAEGTPLEYSDVWINSSELRVVTMLARR